MREEESEAAASMSEGGGGETDTLTAGIDSPRTPAFADAYSSPEPSSVCALSPAGERRTGGAQKAPRAWSGVPRRLGLAANETDAASGGPRQARSEGTRTPQSRMASGLSVAVPTAPVQPAIHTPHRKQSQRATALFLAVSEAKDEQQVARRHLGALQTYSQRARGARSWLCDTHGAMRGA
jgi:hypothetical protein